MSELTEKLNSMVEAVADNTQRQFDKSLDFFGSDHDYETHMEQISEVCRLLAHRSSLCKKMQRFGYPENTTPREVLAREVYHINQSIIDILRLHEPEKTNDNE